VNIKIQNFEVKRIKINPDIEIAYYDEGESEKVIICVHGLGSNKKAFIKNIQHLSKNFRVIAIDLPNYGDSSRGDFPSTMKFFSEVIVEFASRLNLRQFSLCGHSMGGQISVTTAIEYSDLVKSLLLIAPAGLEKFTSDEIKRIQRYFSYDQLKSLTPDQIEYHVKLNFHAFPEDAQFMIDERIELTQKEWFHFYCLAVSRAFEDMLKNPWVDKIHLIKKPTLILFGENDQLIPNKILHNYSLKDLLVSVCKNLDNCMYKILPQCGHFLQFEKPELFNPIASEFFISTL
jgi:pimeloyl-ACP methyl ester carboxylesterase